MQAKILALASENRDLSDLNEDMLSVDGRHELSEARLRAQLAGISACGRQLIVYEAFSC